MNFNKVISAEGLIVMNLRSVHLLLIATALTVAAQEEDGSYCYSDDDEPYIQFGTKTSYELTHGNLADVEIEPGCQPIMMWSLNRHGTRYASKNQIKAFKKLKKTLGKVKSNYEEGNGTMCQEDFDLLMSWKWNSTITKQLAKRLHPQGFKDLKEIAERYKKKYESLLGSKYSSNNYYFQHSISCSTDRTKDSFKAYATGLFGSDDGVRVKESNEIIKEYKDCEIWEDASDKLEDDVYYKFLESEVYQKAAERIARRLGFDSDLDDKLIYSIYMNCVFEKAWSPEKKSKWCTVFTKEDLRVLEYAEDLALYHSTGYGLEEYNRQLGCPMVRDFVEKFNNVSEGGTQPKLVAYFTHSTAIQQFQVALGLYKDEKPLTSDNYVDMSNRKWKTSLIGMFATNFVAVLHKCSDVEKGENTYKVQLYMDEKPIDLNGLCENGFCSWEYLSKALDKATYCNYDFCNSDD